MGISTADLFISPWGIVSLILFGMFIFGLIVNVFGEKKTKKVLDNAAAIVNLALGICLFILAGAFFYLILG